MGEALTPPVLVAALVVAVAGVAKLRAPAAAADALHALGVAISSRSGRALAVRGLATAELGLAAAAILTGQAALLFALAALYVGFALAALRLARAQASCGCFGTSVVPASEITVALNGAFASLCLAGGLVGGHGVGWILSRSATEVPVLVVSILAGAAAAVLAYTELPRAWHAWSGVGAG